MLEKSIRSEPEDAKIFQISEARARIEKNSSPLNHPLSYYV